MSSFAQTVKHFFSKNVIDIKSSGYFFSFLFFSQIVFEIEEALITEVSKK